MKISQKIVKIRRRHIVRASKNTTRFDLNKVPYDLWKFTAKISFIRLPLKKNCPDAFEIAGSNRARESICQKLWPGCHHGGRFLSSWVKQNPRRWKFKLFLRKFFHTAMKVVRLWLSKLLRKPRLSLIVIICASTLLLLLGMFGEWNYTKKTSYRIISPAE